MKKIVLPFLLVLLLLLVACQPGEKAASPTAEPEAPTTVPATEPAPEPTEDMTADDGEGAIAGALWANPWQWISFTSPVEQLDVDGPENYVLTFNEDGTVSVKADCNNASGDYTADGSSLSIQMGPMTTAACPEGSRSNQFVQLLAGAAIYFFEDGNLYIDLMADGGTMTFTPVSISEAAAPEETSPFGDAISWQLNAITDPVNGETVIEESELITFALIDDGSAIIVAGCRVAVGTYETDGNALTLTYDIPEKYDESCEDGPNALRLLQIAQGAAQYYTQDGQLFIELMADGGTLVFDRHQLPEIEPTKTAVDLCGEDVLTVNEIEATLAPEQVAALDEALPTLVSETVDMDPPAPGVSLLVITPEGRYFKSVGVADVSSCQPLAADALFEIGSNTKMMTAAVIFQLQEEGVLSTSDLIGDWVPEMAALIPNSDQITIDMLLTHTSGIYDYINGSFGDGPLAAGAQDKDILTAAYTPAELVELAASSGEPYFAPGEEGQWMYSNTGYILLGQIIEAATGKSYSENLQERIFDPLGLANTFVLEGVPEPGLLPQGYLQPPFDYTAGEWNGSQAWSAGAVISNAEELALFLKALFTGALFQDPTTLDLMLEPALPENLWQIREGYHYGRGMLHKQALLGHGGQAFGYQSDVGYLPEEDVTIVVWSNSSTNAIGQYALTVAQLFGLVSTE